VRLEGERVFDAPREVVWQAVSDPASLAKLMPGVQNFEVADPDHFKAQVKVPLGLGALALEIDFEQAERREPEYSHLKARGRGVGAMLTMETSFELEEEGSGTRMRWSADVSVAGPVGAMGQRVLQPIVRQQVDHVLSALETQVAGADPPAEP
jgi:carbon monoxide dehydrogenase subunit G